MNVEIFAALHRAALVVVDLAGVAAQLHDGARLRAWSVATLRDLGAGGNQAAVRRGQADAYFWKGRRHSDPSQQYAIVLEETYSASSGPRPEPFRIHEISRVSPAVSGSTHQRLTNEPGFTASRVGSANCGLSSAEFVFDFGQPCAVGCDEVPSE